MPSDEELAHVEAAVKDLLKWLRAQEGLRLAKQNPNPRSPARMTHDQLALTWHREGLKGPPRP